MSQRSTRRILRDLKKTGYDGVEIPMFEGDARPLCKARRASGQDRPRTDRRQRAGPRQQSAVGRQGAAAGRASHARNGPSTAPPHLARRSWPAPCIPNSASSLATAPRRPSASGALAFHRRAGDYAAKKNVRFALEALNRFECYFLNTMEQLSDYLDEVDHPAVKAMYDTFHANIEEKDPVGGHQDHQEAHDPCAYLGE